MMCKIGVQGKIDVIGFQLLIAFLHGENTRILMGLVQVIKTVNNWKNFSDSYIRIYTASVLDVYLLCLYS